MTFKEEIIELSAKYSTPELEEIKTAIRESASKGLYMIHVEHENSEFLQHTANWLCIQGFDIQIVYNYDNKHKMKITWK